MNIEITPDQVEPVKKDGISGLVESNGGNPVDVTVNPDDINPLLPDDPDKSNPDYGIENIDLLKEDAKDVEDDTVDLEPALVLSFRKKPVEIEAVLWTGGAESANRIISWILSHDGAADYLERTVDPDTGEKAWFFKIHTLEGDILATPGDWIIRGIKGEFYPCKPDIFDESYASYDFDGDAGDPLLNQDEDVNRRILELCKDLSYIGTREISDKMAKHGFEFTKKA